MYMRKSYSTPSRSRTRIHGLPRRSSRSTAARTASSALPLPALLHALPRAQGPADRHRHRGAGASRDGRHDRSPAYAQFDRGADQGGWVRAVLCRPHDGRFPTVRLGLPVVGEHHAGHGRHHRGPHRGPGCGWCNYISAT